MALGLDGVGCEVVKTSELVFTAVKLNGELGLIGGQWAVFAL